MQGDDPPYLSVGTAVSAKYKGAFCEAKVSKVVCLVKCKVTYKMGLGAATVTNEQVEGTLRVGQIVQARHHEKKEYVEATITKIQDCSQYTVVFDDGDITTLRRTALCLKSGRHFNESETLDQLPLTHPEHFGNPVIVGRRGRRSRQPKDDSSDEEPEEENEPDLGIYSKDVGRVVRVEASDKKRAKDNWFPGLIVVPSAQPTVRINAKEEYLVRSFKDGRYYTVPKKEVLEFSREMRSGVESSVLADAVGKALKFLDESELPVHWERTALFNSQPEDLDSEENITNSSDDEPPEEKDFFVAQLYKFMDERNTPLNDIPTISNKDVDLYRLFRVVKKFGGYNRVTNQKKWRSITIRLGFPHNRATYKLVEHVYRKCFIRSSFEDFQRKLGCTMINHPKNAQKNRGRSFIRYKDRVTPVNSPHPEKHEEKETTTPVQPEKVAPSPKQLEVAVKEEKKNVEEVIKVVEEVKKEKEVIAEKVQTPKKQQQQLEVQSTSKVKEIPVVVEVKQRAISETSDTNSSDDTALSEVIQESIKIADEPRPKRNETKNVKEKKTRAPVGDKVKTLIEKFEAAEVKREEKEREKEKEKEKEREKEKEEEKEKEREKEKEKEKEKEREKEKEKEKEKEDEKERIQQTRSKSQGPGRSKEVVSPDRRPREIKTPSRETGPKTKLAIKESGRTKKEAEDDRAKRGRKRANADDKNSQSDGNTTDSSGPPPVANVGNILKVYYGPTHERLVTYEAKVVTVRTESGAPKYLVHYTGWNTRYDEWIDPCRIAENLSLNTKSKRSKQNANRNNAKDHQSSGPSKPAAKRGRGMSTSNRNNQELPRSTTPSSVTSSSSRTKSPATPMTRSARSARQGEIGRRTRRTSAQTDVSIPSESDSESDIEVAKTRSSTRNEEKEEPPHKTYTKRKVPKRKEADDDTEKEEEVVVERPKRTRKVKTVDKLTVDSEYDSGSPPKGRDFDLNEIRREMKGLKSSTSKVSSTDTSEKDAVSSDDSSSMLDIKMDIKDENTDEDDDKKAKRETSVDNTTFNSDDIYEFKEPEPFEYESRPKLTEEKPAKKRLVPRLFDDLEKPEKTPSPKKKPAKSPVKESQEEKKKMRRTPVKKEPVEDSKLSIKEESPIVMKSEDPFDKLVESPSFHIGSSNSATTSSADKKSANLSSTAEQAKKAVKILNLDESLNLFGELPEETGEDSVDRLQLFESDEAQNEPLFSHKEQLFSDASFGKSSSDHFGLESTYRPFNSKVEEPVKKVKEEDKQDSIEATIQRVINAQSTSMFDDSDDEALLINTPTTSYTKKSKEPVAKSPVTPQLRATPTTIVKTLPVIAKTVPLIVKPAPVIAKTESPKPEPPKEVKIMPDPPKEVKPLKEPEKPKLISPALQETDKTLLNSISLQSELLKIKEENKEPVKPPNPKISDSILEKFNMFKKAGEAKVVKEEVVKVESVPEPKKEIKEKEPEPIPVPKEEPKLVSPVLEAKKRPIRKVVSREFIDSDSDSSDSERRLVIARSDDESQTSDKNLDIKDTDSNTSGLHATTDDSQEVERNFKFDTNPSKSSDLSNPSELSSDVPAPKMSEEISTKSDAAVEVVKEEEPDSNISLLLCKETIPGSPAPVSEGTSSASEPPPRIKPKSAKNLLSEMPFASAPGNSNNKNLLSSDSGPSASKPQDKEPQPLQQREQLQRDQPQLLAVPLEPARDVVLEASTVMDNTPPTTPESTLSNLSPHRDGDLSPNTADNESGKSMDAADLDYTTSSHQRRGLGLPSKPSPYSEEDTLPGEPHTSSSKKARGEEVTAAPCKKRRKSCKGSDEPSLPAKRGRKPNIRSRTNSDSDDNSEHSIPGSTNLLGGSSVSNVERETRLSRSPRPCKYNFFVELDPTLDGAQRIAVLQQKLAELRKTYNDVKAELACIDRRRKKLRRREREAMKAAKQDLACT